ncbi:2-succinyl-5-enolpyruvyl-6-hydroxy-3-cyclohexene-1-carboxylic-acid synthase [Algoriphagus sediminis]|uniref:2-succinyl-5-enolpyruvyl-6-hydroxy-3-cyclohexene-1-carboxylate synthase n=1 Tax=Algoriphagus sediminis TaxID=3057113 RepID=A0ABT7Y831_9BACT|nr:2-succinyl-5-enolpyruvyl-6-hydroxy-3-cyclohexene-1-carboxylic-acid synthase [Algoriphagus sediminis]MDN3202633.1 2-succinyl-5-enolpyruvyl-6-hydroxy-3-cyclohexene-1-carboxylic-acid synthase [Algoriphagus sediminis]
MIIESVSHLVALCAKNGIRHAILSPGSRCAPLTIAFARHPEISTKTVSDERSAAFIALGMAQQTGEPVVLVCTSGSAALNYFPAIAEAFFQQIPLLILTADRPPEWIDQYDGQTIFQEEVYGKHVKKSFVFPSLDNSDTSIESAINISTEAIYLAKSFPKGPVHINLPFREPFYPEEGQELILPETKLQIQPTSKVNLNKSTKSFLEENLPRFKRIMIVAGQSKPDPETEEIIMRLSTQKNVVVVTDVISNFQSEFTITQHDHWLGSSNLTQNLKPDLILSFGMSVISKPLKLFLRSTDAINWHIQESGKARDPFQKLTKTIHASNSFFFSWLFKNLEPLYSEFKEKWTSLNQKAKAALPKILETADFGEYTALAEILPKIPKRSKVHLANSMAVRYVNFLGPLDQEIICNRGTSGIDGSNSTAVGCSLVTDEMVTLITGDMAFFYDRNAFWQNYTKPNLRIIVLNNHAGGIFRLIKGPSSQPELEEYFETYQPLSAESLAHEFGFEYNLVNERDELKNTIADFFSPSEHPKILEIQSESKRNAGILSGVKSKMIEALSEN